MFKVVMRSEGGTTKDFMTGFQSFQEAQAFCENHNWVYTEEYGGFEWSLEIIEN